LGNEDAAGRVLGSENIFVEALLELLGVALWVVVALLCGRVQLHGIAGFAAAAVEDDGTVCPRAREVLEHQGKGDVAAATGVHKQRVLLVVLLAADFGAETFRSEDLHEGVVWADACGTRADGHDPLGIEGPLGLLPKPVPVALPVDILSVEAVQVEGGGSGGVGVGVQAADAAVLSSSVEGIPLEALLSLVRSHNRVAQLVDTRPKEKRQVHLAVGRLLELAVVPVAGLLQDLRSEEEAPIHEGGVGHVAEERLHQELGLVHHLVEEVVDFDGELRRGKRRVRPAVLGHFSEGVFAVLGGEHGDVGVIRRKGVREVVGGAAAPRVVLRLLLVGVEGAAATSHTTSDAGPRSPRDTCDGVNFVEDAQILEVVEKVHATVHGADAAARDEDGGAGAASAGGVEFAEGRWLCHDDHKRLVEQECV